jgi:hypothetical protein
MHQKKERKIAAALHFSLTPKHFSINSLFLSIPEQLAMVLQRPLSSKTTKESKSSTMM